MAVLADEIVPARAPWSCVMEPGDLLRIVDLEGRQAVDFLCFNVDDPAERYHAPNTIKVPKNILLGQGSVLYSGLARPLMTIVSDSVGGHDTIFGCCSFEVDDVRYGRHNDECCQRNFERELARHGIGPELIVPNVNFFMSVPVRPDGHAEIVEGRSRPGDHVELRAEMRVLAVLSNCPQELNPAAGSGPTPIRVIHSRPAARSGGLAGA